MMSAPRRKIAVTTAIIALLAPTPAQATYSIIAVDSANAQVGAAGASCVPYEVIRIYSSAKGRGALVAQANFDEVAQAEGLALLEGGATAQEVLAAVSDAAAHSQAPKMQYGVVDVTGGIATWTGPEALPVAADKQRDLGALRVGALGNILTSEATLVQALDGFESGGCDLAERLMLALEAADDEGEGDSRCTPEGRPANSAFLDVTTASGTAVRISIPDVSPASPIQALRSQFDVWRTAHPCPAPSGAGGGGGMGAGAGASGEAELGDSDGGCGCRTAPSDAGTLPWLGVVLAAAGTLVRRRHRQPSRQCGG